MGSSQLLPGVAISFSIYGTLDPDEVTAVLSVTPSGTSRRGQKLLSPSKKVPVEDSWTLRSKTLETMDATSQVVEFLHRLEPLEEGIREVRSRFPGASFDLTVVAYVPIQGPRPAVPNLFLDQPSLAVLSRLPDAS